MKRRNLIYVLYYFPKISETFVLKELVYFYKHEDYRLKIAAFTSSDAGYDFPLKDELLKDTLYMIRWGKSLRNFLDVFYCFLYFIGLHPSRLIKTVKYLYSYRRYSLLMTALYFSFHYRKVESPHFHAPFSTEQATVAQMAACLLGTTFSFTDQAGDFLQSPSKVALKLQECSFVFSSTWYNLNKVLKFYPQAKAKGDVVYCGVDPLFFSRETPYSLHPFRIISVSRLMEKKGFPYLLEACSILNKDGVDFHLTLIGDGPEKIKLKNMVEEMGLEDRVCVKDATPNAEIRKELEEASLFVLPCIVDSRGVADSQPVVLKEAMSMEIPVVSTPVAGIPELIDHEKNGFLVPSKDGRALSNMIKKIFSSFYDVERIRKNGRDSVVRKFNSRVEICKLEKLFDEYVFNIKPGKR